MWDRPGSSSIRIDFDTTTLSPDENVVLQSYLLYDSESGTLHNRRDNQQLRGGHTVTVDLTSTDPTVGEASPAIFIGGARPRGTTSPGFAAYAVLDPAHRRGPPRWRSSNPPATPPPPTATHPQRQRLRPGCLPGGGLWLAYLSHCRLGLGWISSSRFGWSLRRRRRVRWTWWCRPQPGSGVLFSASHTEAGSESLVVETGFTSTSGTPRTSYFYVQGTIQGDDVDDDVPMTIDVFETTTTTPAGYEQADKPSDVDVGPSGFQFYDCHRLGRYRRSHPTRTLSSSPTCFTTASRAPCTTGVITSSCGAVTPSPLI